MPTCRKGVCESWTRVIFPFWLFIRRGHCRRNHLYIGYASGGGLCLGWIFRVGGHKLYAGASGSVLLIIRESGEVEVSLFTGWNETSHRALVGPG